MSPTAMSECIDKSDSFYKLRIFLEDPHAKIITGPRRFGKTELLDILISEIKDLCPSSNVIRLNKRTCPESTLRNYTELLKLICNNLKEGQKNYIIVDDANTTSNWETIAEKISAEEKYEIEMYCGQDLCHQVPACIRWIKKSD